MWGTNARRFASLSPDERTRTILKCIEKIHQIKPAQYVNDVDKDVVHYAWDEQENPGGGAFAFFGPGEQARYQAALCAPHLMGGRAKVFFAGEHVAIAHAWIQSAVQSALGSVIDVLESP